MAKYDEQLNRMNYLMEYKTPKNEVKGNIEYHANGADGKVYGILKEGTKYYIKTTESGKENIAESYDYINGFNNRKENEFKSYNDATKHLELKLMSLNEAYGKHEDVSTVDFKRGEKVLANLTEEARKELDRMNQIFENSFISKDNIGNHGNPEPKGTSTGAQTEKNNDPFSEKANANLDKDPKAKGTVESATDNKEVGEPKMDDDSMRKGGKEQDNYKKTSSDLDGSGYGDKEPKDAKAVKPINESMFEMDDDFYTPEPDMDDPMGGSMEEPMGEPMDDSMEEPMDAAMGDSMEEPMNGPMEEPVASNETGDDVVGQGDEDIESLLEELEANFSNKEKDAITGPEVTMDGPHGSLDVQSTDRLDKNGNIDECGGACSGKKQEECVMEDEDYPGGVDGPDTDVMDNEKNDDKKLPVQSMDRLNSDGKLNEAINSLVEDVYKKLIRESQEAKLRNKINKIVKEEITKLDAWGKHPKFQKEPMQLPPNKEVMKGTADRDFNDDSAKQDKPYGQKIGDGKPFDQIVQMLTDQVMANLKENLKR